MRFVAMKRLRDVGDGDYIPSYYDSSNYLVRMHSTPEDLGDVVRVTMADVDAVVTFTAYGDQLVPCYN